MTLTSPCIDQSLNDRNLEVIDFGSHQHASSLDFKTYYGFGCEFTGNIIVINRLFNEGSAFLEVAACEYTGGIAT